MSRPSQANGHLSLGEQEHVLKSYVDEHAGSQLLGVQKDVFSGRGDPSSRPGLAEAIRLCKENVADLIVSDVDRLARNEDAASLLQAEGVAVVSVSEGEVSREGRLLPLLLRARRDSDAISISSRASADRRRAAGGQLGNLENLVAHRARGTASNQARASEKIQQLVEVLTEHPELLKMTHKQTVNWLNDNGILNRKSTRRVPCKWLPGALRKPLKAARRKLEELGASRLTNAEPCLRYDPSDPQD
ncbi:recombinase family protein [Roseivivax marinus]|uniref:recombinase family protein n=1 Tax=Roseivivax marinus TaxID=1379903 RepID=UPI003B977D72